MKTLKLIKVEPGQNNNKFYDMKQVDNDNWQATWGRVGTAGQQMTYPMKQWQTKYNEKVKKGYVDQTHLFAENTDSSSPTSAIKNSSIKRLVDQLLKYAKETVSQNYLISSDAVTQAMVDEAQKIIDELVLLTSKKVDIQKANNLLLNLYKTLPRKMKNVQAELLKNGTSKELNQKISSEQDLLDVMRGQVKVASPATTTTSNSDILASFGLEIEEATPKDIAIIKKMMKGEEKLFKSAYVVVHKDTRKHLEKKKTELQWHGSRNENWWNILKIGLKIRPANAVHTGSMFGNGIYHSKTFKKSLGYTSYHNSYWARGNSSRAFLAINELYTGNQLLCTKHNSEFSCMTWDRLRKKGDYHSVHAPKGYDLYNDETIVYREDQVSIKYLVEVGD